MTHRHVDETPTRCNLGNSTSIDSKPCGDVVLSIAAKQHALDERGVSRAQGNPTWPCTIAHDVPHAAWFSLAVTPTFAASTSAIARRV